MVWSSNSSPSDEEPEQDDPSDDDIEDLVVGVVGVPKSSAKRSTCDLVYLLVVMVSHKGLL